MIGKTWAKDFLVNFKRDTMNGLIDQGFLETPVRNSLGLIYVP